MNYLLLFHNFYVQYQKKISKKLYDLLNEFPSVSFYSNNGSIITTEEFPYAHCFDETEKLILDNEKIKGKSYIRLKIDVDLYLANDATYKLFNELKSSFITLTGNNNVQILTELNRYGPKCLIRLENKGCCLINKFWFIFFTVLSFGEIYALILKLISVEESIILKKIITTKINFRAIDDNQNGEEAQNQINNQVDEDENKKDEDKIIIYNNKNKLNEDKNNANDVHLENEPNRNTERESILTYPGLNEDNK